MDRAALGNFVARSSMTAHGTVLDKLGMTGFFKWSFSKAK
jgi:hypothetical protein